MASEVITVYAGEQAPEYWDACVFIGGATPGPSSPATAWQPEVLALLREQWGSDGRLVVFVPEPADRVRDGVVGPPMDWYDHALDVADVVIFWWPDDTDPRLLSTNIAGWSDGQRVVHGTPPQAPHSHYLFQYADRHAMSTATTLAGIAHAALDKIGDGARRSAGERDVPLAVWRSDSFQRWYAAQTSAGNTLLGARQVWTFSTGPRRRFLLYWALHVRIHVRTEDRVKSNEVIISRPDISMMALYKRAATLDDTIIVLVREFRSPASTPDGLVHELPGGSGSAAADPLDQAVSEAAEETGLAIDMQRIRAYGDRQLTATLSAHHAHLFAAEITATELAQLRATQSTPHGADDTERTWTEVTTFGEIRRNRLVDWATLGMIAEVLLDQPVVFPQPAVPPS